MNIDINLDSLELKPSSLRQGTIILGSIEV